MRESDLDKKIHKACIRRGAYHQKITANEFMRGVPDHVIAYKGRFILIEAKMLGGKFQPGQLAHLRRAQAAGCIGEVCYDATLLDRIFDCIDEGRTWQNGNYDEC